MAIDFDSWANRRTHDKAWIADANRTSAIESIQAQALTSGLTEIRVQGDSGIGKTRMVLEALRHPSLSALVAYVDDERAVGGELLTHLVSEGRTAILVVDECPAARHIKMVEKLPRDPAVKLITIGDAGDAASRTPVISLGAVEPATTEKFLEVNYQHLSPESKRFVEDHSRGNMRWTIVLADRVAEVDVAQAADLIARNDIEQFITALLPEGRGFFCASIIALLDRVGWDGQLRYQLELLADFANVPVATLEEAAARLEARGLLIRQGRYRAISPHPLAVFLAAEAWRLSGTQLVRDLLPRLNPGMALAFFRRAADLGRFQPAQSALPQLLSHDGPFSSLAQIEDHGLGQILTQLAIVLPDEVTTHLAELIEEAEREELLQYRQSRRDLVWTLEKLVWHSRTFEVAADSLLRLALAEVETFANNATGTWVDLFGTMLPATAASPAMRISYLEHKAAANQKEIRRLVVDAASAGLVLHETVTVSGELQGGVLVEPRGTPATWGDAADYRKHMVLILSRLVEDPEEEVAAAAVEALIKAMHPMIANPVVGDALLEAFAEFEGENLRRLRAAAADLLSLYDRRERRGSSNDGDERIVERITALLNRLPTPSLNERLQIVSALRRWDLREGELGARVREVLEAFAEASVRRAAVAAVLVGDLPASWEIGQQLARVDGYDDEIIQLLTDRYDVAPSALIGYLTQLTADGDDSAFDEFLDSEHAQRDLSIRSRITITAQGPLTPRARDRVREGMSLMSVADSVYAVFGWHQKFLDSDVAHLVTTWIARIETQLDYNAVLDWLSLTVHPESGVPQELKEPTWQLLQLRANYPELGKDRWDWSNLASRLAQELPVELAKLILSLVEDGKIQGLSSSEEARLLGQCADADAEAVWAEVAERLVQGSWRLQMSLQNWFLAHVPREILANWVGTDVQRARVVAAIAPVGKEDPTEVTRFLLGNFGDDPKVAGSLHANLVSGTWWGNESERIARQIERLKRWRQDAAEPIGLRRWARKVAEGLEENRQAALLREAEERF
ncbi:hypothetical protein ACIQAR_11755 [Micromonospora chalcea]